MMETKLWIALCAILVIHSGSATPDNNHTAALSVPDPSPGSTNHSLRILETDPGSNATGSLNSTTSANITTTPEPRINNVVTTASDATSTKSENVTHLTLSPSQSHPTTPVPTHKGTTHMNQTPFLNTSVTPTPLSNYTLSQQQNISATSQQTRNTSQSNRLSPTTQPNSQANARTNPMSLNGDDTTTDRGSPALDPLLAGLVSAFIIAAVIITLLLFLKLRRRGNRPEFRRLQDLPMDEMEDTPLSMYSY